MAKAATFAVNTRSKPAIGYGHCCDRQVTEFLRNAAVVALFKQAAEKYTRRASNVPQGR